MHIPMQSWQWFQAILAIRFSASGLPVRIRFRRESLPVNASRKPSPLGWCQGEGRGIRAWPDETAAVQSALTEPDTGAVPHEQFEPGQPPVTEGVGAAVAG